MDNPVVSGEGRWRGWCIQHNIMKGTTLNSDKKKGNHLILIFVI